MTIRLRWWPWHHRTDPDTAASTARADDTERRVTELQGRVDQVTGQLRRRQILNTFAEGIGVAWGAKHR